MKFWEAMKALEEGKRVRMCQWPKESYIHINITNYIENEKYDDCSINFTSGEWELYVEPVKTYTFQEIIPFLKEGKKVNRVKNKTYPIEMDGKYCYFSTRGASAYLFSMEDLEANDWIVVVDKESS